MLEITENEILPFYDETGYLSIHAINKFLATKKICKFGRNDELILIVDKNYKTPYFELVEKIKKIDRKRQYKKAGNMGVDVDALTKDINKIDEKQITQIKNDEEQYQEEITEDILSKW